MGAQRLCDVESPIKTMDLPESCLTDVPSGPVTTNTESDQHVRGGHPKRIILRTWSTIRLRMSHVSSRLFFIDVGHNHQGMVETSMASGSNQLLAFILWISWTPPQLLGNLVLFLRAASYLPRYLARKYTTSHMSLTEVLEFLVQNCRKTQPNAIKP